MPLYLGSLIKNPKFSLASLQRKASCLFIQKALIQLSSYSAVNKDLLYFDSIVTAYWNEIRAMECFSPYF